MRMFQILFWGSDFHTINMASLSVRMLVYEYIDNGDLHQWLHGRRPEEVSPLTWSVRVNIIRGIAKG